MRNIPVTFENFVWWTDDAITAAVAREVPTFNGVIPDSAGAAQTVTAALEHLLAERHIDLDRPAVTYCQSGGRAAVVAFALELMGGKQVSNYYRSWAEWGNDPKTPVGKPQRK